MQTLLNLNTITQNTFNVPENDLQTIQKLITESAVLLPVKMYLTESCIKQVGELQVIALKLFSNFD